MADVNDRLVIELQANLDKLDASLKRAVPMLDSAATRMERRAKEATSHIEKLFGEMDLGKAMNQTFAKTRFAAFEEGAARIPVFGSALEELGPAGLIAAAGIAAAAVAIEGIKKATEEVGELAVQARKLGVTAEQLQEMRFVGQESHIPVQQVDLALQELNATLGKLRSGIGAQRLVKLQDYLGFAPADLEQYKNAADFLPALADKIKALPTIAEQSMAAQKFGVLDLLPMLVKGRDGIAELTEEYKRAGVEISGEFADAVEEGNLKMEKAHNLLHDKLTKDMAELHPVLEGLTNAWDSFADAAIRGFEKVGKGYNTLMRGLTVTALMPGTIMAAAMGDAKSQKALGDVMNPPRTDPFGAPQPKASPKPSGPTNDQIQGQIAATKIVSELQAQLLTHSTHRLEVERKIAEAEQKQGHALDANLKKQLLAAATALDAKPADHAANAEQKKADADAKHALEVSKSLKSTFDEGDKAREAAMAALTENILLRADFEKKASAAEARKTDDALADREAEINADKQLTAEKKKELVNQIEATRRAQAAAEAAKQQKIDRETGDKVIAERLSYEEKIAGYATSLLNDTASMVASSQERRRLSLAILAIEQEIARKKLAEENKIAVRDGNRTPEEAAALTALQNATQASQTQKTLYDTQSPGEAYASQLNKDSGSLTDQFQNIDVSGLKSLGEALDAVILKTKTAKEAFHEWAMGVVKDMLSLATKNMIEKPLANLMFPGAANKGGQGSQAAATAASATALNGLTSAANSAALALSAMGQGQGLPGAGAGGGTGGYGGGLSLGAFSSLAKLIPGFADGTDSAPGGPAWVGEDGPELMNLPRGTSITPMNALRAARSLSPSSMRGTPVINSPTFNMSGAVVTEELLRQVNAISAQHGRNAVAQAVQISRRTTRDDMNRQSRQTFGR